MGGAEEALIDWYYPRSSMQDYAAKQDFGSDGVRCIFDFILFWFGGLQREVKNSAVARRRFRPYPPALEFDNTLHKRQADAGPFRAGIKFIEKAEDAL